MTLITPDGRGERGGSPQSSSSQYRVFGKILRINHLLKEQGTGGVGVVKVYTPSDATEDENCEPRHDICICLRHITLTSS